MFLIFINPKNIIIIIYNKSFDTMVIMFLLIYTLTENIALHKPAHQMYRYTGLSVALTEASNAVDGLKSNLSVWGEQCVISGEYKQTATWWVNLTNILSIHHVSIYYRTGNAPWGELYFFHCKFQKHPKQNTNQKKNCFNLKSISGHFCL